MIKVEHEEDLDEEISEDEQTRVEVTDKVANVYLNGPICNETIQPVVGFLVNSSLTNSDIVVVNIFIDSTGGDLDSAMKMIDGMKLCNLPIRTIGWGKVASAALMIHMHGDQRIYSENCSILSHNASFNATSYSIRVNDPSQQREFKLITDRIVNLYKKCSGKDERYIRKHLLKDYDVCLSAEEAIKHGLADGLMPSGTDWLKTLDTNHQG